MANTAAYYTTKLAAIDAAIDNLVANPRPNYKVGNTMMNFGDLIGQLEKARDRCLQLLQSLQNESFETLNTDINVFGQDLADYINEPNA